MVGLNQIKVRRPNRYSDPYRLEEPRTEAGPRLPMFLSMLLFGVPLWILIYLVVHSLILYFS
jgi:hypothetical protein